MYYTIPIPKRGKAGAMDIRTQNGYSLYEVASALQKACRRGDFRLAGYMGLELFPRFHKYAWKRILTVSAEDCAGCVTQEVLALHDAFYEVNKGKTTDKMGGRIFISKAILVLCMAKHNRDADILSNYVHDKMSGITDEQIESYLDEARKERPDIPEYVYDVHTIQGKRAGKTKRMFFREEQEALVNQQPSLFDLSKL